MSFDTTSSSVWWFLRPLIAANMPRIMGHRSFRSGDLADVGRVDPAHAVDGQSRGPARGLDALDRAGLRLVVGVDVAHGVTDQRDGLLSGLGLGEVRLGGGQVGDLLGVEKFAIWATNCVLSMGSMGFWYCS